jgi:acyl-CoA thioester hydrolase
MLAALAAFQEFKAFWLARLPEGCASTCELRRSEEYNPPMTHPDLAAFPVVIELDVAWGDMDSYGHVNNVVYFRYFENARIAYLDRVGWSASKERSGLGPILHSTSARFRKAVTYPDHLHAGARVIDIQADRVVFEFRLVSEKLNAVA